MENELRAKLQIVTTGTREEIRAAQKAIEKLWNTERPSTRGTCNRRNRKVFNVYKELIEGWDSIKDIDHQYALVNTLKWAFFVVPREQFEYCKNFALRILEHPSGKLRQSMIHAADWLTMSLRLWSYDHTTHIMPKRMKEDRLRFCVWVEEIEQRIEKYHDHSNDHIKHIDELPPSVEKSLELFLAKLLRSPYLEKIYDAYVNGKLDDIGVVDDDDDDYNDDYDDDNDHDYGEFIEPGHDGKPTMPKWLECTWKRVPCGKDECPICGRMNRDRKKHLERGEDPEDAHSLFEDMSSAFREAMTMMKKEMEMRGVVLSDKEEIELPPKPKHFPVYRKVGEWREFVMGIARVAEEEQCLWLATEAAADLFWYANTLTAKVYRQLCNSWQLTHGEQYGDFDHQYTKEVLSTVLRIVEKSLGELALLGSEQKGELILARAKFESFKHEILTI